MKAYLKILIFVFTIQVIFNFGYQLNAQTNPVTATAATDDSMVLQQIMQTVIQGHPTVKEAEEALSVAETRVSMAKSDYYPNVDATASYTRLGPAPSLTIPGMGSFQLFPQDNFASSVNYNQVVYDFGKTKKNVGLQNENKVLAVNNIDMVKQKLSLQTANSFYNIVYLQEAIKIKDLELKTLNEHLEFVQKRKATGSATQYEFLTTQVRISTAESQKLDLQTSLKIQQTILTSLMGLTPDKQVKVKQDMNAVSLSIPEDSLLNYAYNHRLELVNAREKEKIAGMQYDVVKSENNPVVNIFASGGAKNGYVPELNVVKADFTAGVGVRVPLFDGYRKKYNLQQAKSGMNTSSMETNLIQRNITDEVITNEANRISALQKIKQNELQVAQAEEAFSLAQTNFNAGAITNVDLLDAENKVSDSRLTLLQSKIMYNFNVFQLNISLGNKMY